MRTVILASLVITFLLATCSNEPQYERYFPTESLVPFDSSALDTTSDFIPTCGTSVSYADFDGSENEFEGASCVFINITPPYLLISDTSYTSQLKLLMDNTGDDETATVAAFKLVMNDGSILQLLSGDNNRSELDVVWYATDPEKNGAFSGEIWGHRDGAAEYDTVSVSGTFCF